MPDQENRNEQLKWLTDLWRSYGEEYNIFIKAEQPVPQSWDLPLQEPDSKGVLDPHTIKHWRAFEWTKSFLTKQYGILAGPALIFDCLVPNFQKGLSMTFARGVKLHPNGDPLQWYNGVLEMFLTSQDEVGFDCHSTECLRTRCKLNLRNPNRISPVDIYSLIQIFHGYRSVRQAIRIVSEEFGKISKFESRGVQEKDKIFRYAVPKHEIYDLVERYAGKRRQHIPQLIEEATDLIQACKIVELDHGRVFSDYFAFLWPQIMDNNILARINGLAIRLYLWLLVRQEENARENKWGMELTDAEVARQLGTSTSRKTAGIYREELQKLGLLVIREGLWTVNYKVNFQRNT